MQKSTVSALALLAALAFAPAAQAAEGWYARADVGYSLDGEISTDLASVPGDEGSETFGGKGELDEDFSGHIGVGKALANGLRFEGEISQRFNEIEATTGIRDGSDIRAWAAMLNGYFDFNRGGRIEPYVGVGAGLAKLTPSIQSASGAGSVDDDDTPFAYQGMVGVAAHLTKRIAIDLGYRYFAAPDAEFDGQTRLDGDYEHQAVTLGLRLKFPPAAAAAAAPAVAAVTEPAPPPPPTVAPTPATPRVCPPTSVVVYFDWDRADLNAAAEELLTKTIADARECNYAQVSVVGHTDTSGSRRYNMGLSSRRAAVVKNALEARGVPAAVISSNAMGEAELAKATRDGVREPLNRRSVVAITFR